MHVPWGHFVSLLQELGLSLVDPGLSVLPWQASLGSSPSPVADTLDPIFPVATPFAQQEDYFSCFLSLLELHLYVFCRSLLLLYLLSVANVCCRGVPLAKGSARRNAFLRGSRSFFKGAPVILACFWVSSIPQVALAVQHNGMRGGMSDSSDSRLTEELSSSHVPVDAPPRLSTREAITGPALCGRTVAQGDFCTHVGVFGFQTTTRKFQLPLEDGDAVECFLQLIRGYDSSQISLLAVTPQPAVDFFACVAFPGVLQQLGKVPVLVQVFGFEVVEFVDFFSAELCIEDLHSSLGHLWEDDFVAYVGDAHMCLEPGECAALSPGMLVMIMPRHLQVPRRASPCEVLQDPDTWLAEAPTDDGWEGGQDAYVGFVGSLGQWRTAQDDDSWDTTKARLYIAEQHSLRVSSVSLHTPVSLPADLHFYGKSITALWGALPFDAAFALSMLEPWAVRFNSRIHVTALLSRLGAGAYDPQELRVRGASCYDRSHGTLLPAHAAVITVTLQCLAAGAEEVCESGGPPMEGGGVPVLADDATRAGHSDVVAPLPDTEGCDDALVGCRLGDTPEGESARAAAYQQGSRLIHSALQFAQPSDLTRDVVHREGMDRPLVDSPAVSAFLEEA